MARRVALICLFAAVTAPSRNGLALGSTGPSADAALSAVIARRAAILSSISAPAAAPPTPPPRTSTLPPQPPTPPPPPPAAAQVVGDFAAEAGPGERDAAAGGGKRRVRTWEECVSEVLGPSSEDERADKLARARGAVAVPEYWPCLDDATEAFSEPSAARGVHRAQGVGASQVPHTNLDARGPQARGPDASEAPQAGGGAGVGGQGAGAGARRREARRPEGVDDRAGGGGREGRWAAEGREGDVVEGEVDDTMELPRSTEMVVAAAKARADVALLRRFDAFARGEVDDALSNTHSCMHVWRL